ncbi:DUF6551 family protein [Maritalea sp.]|jgi:hypothetical protein|uniref:DUF6551 family protein n=1 Tax=Maritalea sp. TaxID=2003361 RepID=UPI0039E62AEB
MPEINMEIGAQPALEWVPVNLIDVDSNYQREVDGARVNKILRDFKWDHFGAVVLVPADDGRYFVTDGQHRVKAASLHPMIEQVPATIVTKGELKDAAGNFLAINRDRKAVNAIEKYWAGMAAEDADCLRIGAALSEAGCDIVPEHGYARPNLTHSVTSIGRALRRDGHSAVVKAMQTICRARPSDNAALKGTLVSSVSQVISENESCDLDRLSTVLVPLRDNERNNTIEAHKNLNGSGSMRACAGAIVAMYNKGLSAKKISEPKNRAN